MNRRRAAVLLAGLVALVGLLTAGAAAQESPPPDPEEDVIGWENGYWHNESIDVDQSDGLSTDEQEEYVSRAMARIEVLRDREFEETVPVSIVSRDDFGNQTRGNASANFTAWNNQVWEALFVVGEDEDVQNVLHSTATAQTTGGYFYERDEIVIVADDPEEASIGRGTLVHELLHAQQDQYVDLANVSAGAETQDAQLAVDGLVEGEANYIEDRYEARCGAEWECVSSPGAGGGSGGDLNLGIYLALFHPYSDGPPYVHSLYEDEGWDAVDAGYETPPNSTEQIIHHTDEEPAPLDVEDEARAGWEPFLEQGRNGTDTAGEASIFAMFWYQAREEGAETLRSTGSLFDDDGPYDTYNYEAEPSAGWANDAILPYRKETADGPEYGYVWATEWDTSTDASEFRTAYLSILDAHEARQIDSRTWVVDSGRFADAFRVVRNGSRVTIVNAPAPDDLNHVAPSIEPGEPLTTETPDPDESPTVTADPATSTPPDEPAVGLGQVGAGVVVALVAVAAATLLLRARRRRGT